MPKPVRLSDIAEQLGVSTVTVSKALTGKKGMSEALREKIRETAGRLGYEQSAGERRNTGNIGILVQSRYFCNTISFYWDLYRRLLGFLQDETYFGILEIIMPDDEKTLAVPRLFRERKIDGIIVIGTLDREYRRFIASLAEKSATSLVFLDSDEGGTGNICVVSDGYYGMYHTTDYLIGMGHRDIRFVGSIEATSSILDRYYGYCRAMRENGLNAAEPIPDRDENGVMGISLPESLPSAFACNSDVTAAHLINLLMERNIGVPGDISIVGFDDYLFPGFVRVPLTTWAVDMDAMARTAVEIITGRIKPGKARTLVICGHLVLRDSVTRREEDGSRR